MNAVIGCILVLVSALAFSGKAVLAKLLYRLGVDPLTVIGLRMGISLPIFAASAGFAQRRAAPLARRDFLAAMLLGGVGYYASVFLDFAGLNFISAGLERLIMFTYPTIVLLLAVVALKERLRFWQGVSLVLSYAGIALAFRAESAGHTAHAWLGAALVFGSAVSYAVYLVGATPYIRRLGAERFTALALSAACVAALVHWVLGGGRLLGLSLAVYGLSAAMALGATVLPAFTLAQGIRRIGPGAAAVIGTVGPVSTLLIAHWLLAEPLSLVQAGGTLLVLLGATVVAIDRYAGTP